MTASNYLWIELTRNWVNLNRIKYYAHTLIVTIKTVQCDCLPSVGAMMTDRLLWHVSRDVIEPIDGARHVKSRGCLTAGHVHYTRDFILISIIFKKYTNLWIQSPLMWPYTWRE